MKPINSVVAFFRNALKIKGRSEHWFRGEFILLVSDESITADQLVSRMRTLIAEWQEANIVEAVTEDDEWLTAIIKKEAFNVNFVKAMHGDANNLYRHLRVKKQEVCVSILWQES